jgi:hypothetical protein
MISQILLGARGVAVVREPCEVEHVCLESWRSTVRTLDVRLDCDSRLEPCKHDDPFMDQSLPVCGSALSA